MGGKKGNIRKVKNITKPATKSTKKSKKSLCWWESVKFLKKKPESREIAVPRSLRQNLEKGKGVQSKSRTVTEIDRNASSRGIKIGCWPDGNLTTLGKKKRGDDGREVGNECTFFGEGREGTLWWGNKDTDVSPEEQPQTSRRGSRHDKRGGALASI